MNRVTLIGHLAADPDIRHLNDGKQVASFALATNDHWTDKATGERKSRAEFHRVVTFNEGLIANVIEPYARKGKQAIVEGGLRTRKWTDAAGQERYTTEIVIGPFGTFTLLGPAPATRAPAEPARTPPAHPQPAPVGDDIPF